MKKKMRFVYGWLVIVLVGYPFQGNAQEHLNVKTSCSYYGEQIESDLFGFASDAEAQIAVDRVMRYTGLPQNFVIMAANVDNAAAAIQGSDRYILYNQDFMLLMKDLTRTDWSALSIMAHEIGHHLAGHTLLSEGSRPKEELEADKFSGFLLYKMGATRDQAQIVMKTIASEKGSKTHPPKSARLAAITNGWVQARDEGSPQPISTSPTQTNNTQFIVLAKAEWQDSGVIIQKGERITMKASGKWTTFAVWINPTPYFNPDGFTDAGQATPAAQKEKLKYNVLREAQHGALICRIGSGDSVKYYEIGKGGEFIAGVSGSLACRINDTAWEYNDGSATVDIRISR